MRTMAQIRTLCALCVCAALLGMGCRSEPLKLDTIQIGRALSTDNRIGQITIQFRPDDTIYVSVLTTDMGSGLIGVKWMYGDRLISEPSKQVSYKGPAATEFHIQNSGGFPEGQYSVEAFIDGVSVGRRPFSVARPE